MKKYIIDDRIGYKAELTESEFIAWKREQASKCPCGIYRVVGDTNSNHYSLDFQWMWSVTVVDED